MAEPWTPPTLPDIYRAMATVAAMVPGFRSAVYPAPNKLPLVPALIIFGGTGTITHQHYTEQEWSIRVRSHLAVALQGASEREITAVDSLLMPLVDAFGALTPAAPGAPDGFTLGGRVSRCVVNEWADLGLLTYGLGGARVYWGLPVFFDIKLERHAGGDVP